VGSQKDETGASGSTIQCVVKYVLILLIGACLPSCGTKEPDGPAREVIDFGTMLLDRPVQKAHTFEVQVPRGADGVRDLVPSCSCLEVRVNGQKVRRDKNGALPSFVQNIQDSFDLELLLNVASPGRQYVQCTVLFDDGSKHVAVLTGVAVRETDFVATVLSVDEIEGALRLRVMFQFTNATGNHAIARPELRGLKGLGASVEPWSRVEEYDRASGRPSKHISYATITLPSQAATQAGAIEVASGGEVLALIEVPDVG